LKEHKNRIEGTMEENKTAVRKSRTKKTMTKINEAEFFDALFELISATEGIISSNELVDKVKVAIEKAVKKSHPNCEKIFVDIDTDKKKIDAAVLKLVVDDKPLDESEINIDAARLINRHVQDGDMIRVSLNIAEFGRQIAGIVKQTVKDDVKAIHREAILAKFEEKEQSCITVKVLRVEGKRKEVIRNGEKLNIVELNIAVDYQGQELYLFQKELIPNERLKEGQYVKVYIPEITNKSKKRPIVKISRTNPELLKCLMQMNIPEIEEGIIEIKSIAREPGIRSKVAVISHDENINAVSSCIGKKHKRIQPISDELNGEKIDVIHSSEKPEEYIAEALAPATITEVIITDTELRQCTVTVAPEQLSLAIGSNRGQNVRLAAKLTGYKINILSDENIEEIGEANLLAEENRIKYEQQKLLETVDSFELADDDDSNNVSPYAETEFLG
jgi:N utilization substance protein A